ncbi:EAL domain-containing protein [Paenibacillus chartarius]|uniref:EAL domain-containing protein n=1 Tax=Paenibacillus chartarius TaxID=747481 RepID=A0ABV6DIL9_9BACL
MSKPTIGVLTPATDGFYFNGILQGIHERAQELGANVIVIRTYDSNHVNEYHRYLAFDHIDGWIVILNAVEQTAYLRRMEHMGKPIVCTPSPNGFENSTTFGIDNEQGGYEAAKHLIEHGHRDIGMVYSTTNAESVLRYNGYLRALAEHGLASKPHHVFDLPNLWEKYGVEAGRLILKRGIDFSAIVVSSDVIAVGIVQTLQSVGIRVPHQLALVSFDNTDYAKRFSLTSLAQPLYERGRSMLERVWRQLHTADRRHETIMEPMHLVVRQSCGCHVEEQELQHAAQYYNSLDMVEFLSNAIQRNHRIGRNLVGGDAAKIKSLSWLADTSFTWGCMARWMENRQLVIESVYSTKPTALLEKGEVYREEAFPPLSLYDLLNDREAVVVHSVKTLDRDIGFLVLIGNIFNQQQNGMTGTLLHSMTHTIDLFSYALEREAMYEEARDRENRLEIVSSTTNDGIFDWNLTTNLMLWNRKIHHILDHEGLTMQFGDFAKRIAADDLEQLRVALDAHYEQHIPFQAEFRMLKNENEVIWIRAAGEALRDAEGVPVRMIGSIVDITERKRAEEKIQQIAYTDFLTSLPNRRYIYERIAEEVSRRDASFAVILLDLDRFKVINDSLGHMVGDELLRHVAQMLSASADPQDVVARLGGDEFIIVCTGLTEPSRPLETARSILTKLSQPITIDGQLVYATTSMGISYYPEHGDDREQLIQHADIAMYRAKEEGKNRFQVYHPDMHTNSMNKLTMESCLRGALDAGEFEVHYQPQLDLHTDTVMGFEALLRWNSPVFGKVSPLDFIPLAEETRLIFPITEWVLYRACNDTKRLLEEGFPSLLVSVNISALHLADSRLIHSIRSILRQTGLPAHHLCLEITERAAIQHLESTVCHLHELREIGVKIALDDFGVGNSSLSLINTLPLDTIKIDQMFVRSVSKSEISTAIFTTILGLVSDLNLDSCVEGIEMPEQLEFAKTRRCRFAQGFHIGKPLPYEELKSYLRNRMP